MSNVCLYIEKVHTCSDAVLPRAASSLQAYQDIYADEEVGRHKQTGRILRPGLDVIFFCKMDTVAFSLLFGKYCPIMV
jgi:hypothetical protein